MGAAVEHVDVVLAVHADRGAVPIGEPGGQRAPALDHPIAVAAFAQNDRLGGGARGGVRRRQCGEARRASQRRADRRGGKALRRTADGGCGQPAKRLAPCHRTEQAHFWLSSHRAALGQRDVTRQSSGGKASRPALSKTAARVRIRTPRHLEQRSLPRPFMDDANCVRSSLAEVKRAHARCDRLHRAAPLSPAAEDRPDE